MSRKNPSAAGADYVPQLGLVAALASLGGVFWVLGAMEMVERLAFYGVKAVAALYATDARSRGGLGVTAASLGNVFLAWALVQSVLPIGLGGLADRFGYKRTILVSTFVKIAGYLVMAALPSSLGFFLGAMLLATGTAIFKPGIQGLLVRSTDRHNSSVAWGVFYQLVNVGGWLGPLLAAFMRGHLDWRSVFVACAVVITCNFGLLAAVREPAAPQGDASAEPGASADAGESLWRASLRELSRPLLWPYLLIMSGFWFMFNSLFDVLPLHIRDWVDTSQLVRLLLGEQGASSSLLRFFLATDATGQRIQPEGMLNLNAALIMTTCFLVAGLSAKLRATSSMVIGTLLAVVAMLVLARSEAGLWCALAILVFSVGEMLSSPKSSEYIANLAPPRRVAMYLGFSQIPLAIGWSLEGKLGPLLYDRWASKERFAREALAVQGWSGQRLASVPEGDAFARLVSSSGRTAEAWTQQLYAEHAVGRVWLCMAAVGLLSALGLLGYAQWLRRRQES